MANEKDGERSIIPKREASGPHTPAVLIGLVVVVAIEVAFYLATVLGVRWWSVNPVVGTAIFVPSVALLIYWIVRFEKSKQFSGRADSQ